MQDPEIILYQLNHYKPLIDKAIKLTYEYVSNNKLVLTGGMAIDIALRAKGQSIYSDDSVPDYDIISDKNLFHANALAEIFCKEGLTDVDVINAVHITTVRVRMKRIVFLDATYIPTSCMERVPYLDIDNLRVVHPHYQFIDQRSSLSTLMADTGSSLNIFNRLKKDVRRNNLLRDLYPIEPSKIGKIKTKTVRIPLDLIRVDDNKVEQSDSKNFIYTGSSCVAGFVGFMITMAFYNNKMNELKVTDKFLEVAIPTTEKVRILSCDIDSLKSFIKNPKWYRPLTNLKPITQTDGDFEYVDSYGLRLGCNFIQLSKSLKICVASIDYLLMEQLRDRVYVSEEPYSTYYTELVNASIETRLSVDSDDFWWPSLNCYGSENLPEYKVFMLEKLMDPESSKSLKPKHSYPRAPHCSTRPDFEQEGSHYFRIDGSEDKTITHSNYTYIIEAFKKYVDKKRSSE